VLARINAHANGSAFDALLTVAPGASAYPSDVDDFDLNWKARLLGTKL
jgi:hypothetical protein